ncbi:MAG: protein kinase [Pirellulaceae bacterium]|nr:protein kinase [Pirellulaceae bacterium]
MQIQPDPKVGHDLSSFTSLPLLNISERYKFKLGQTPTGSIRTFMARERSSGRRVLIKHLNLCKDTEDAEVIGFISETQCLQRLDHTNILNAHECARTLEGPFIVLEHFDGSELGSLVKKNGLGVDEALAITIKACKAIEYCHRQGIVHRNINPNSIFVHKDRRVKLTDFRRAAYANAETLPFDCDDINGAKEYIAPEGVQGINALNQVSDLWSLAAILYLLLSGKSPRILRRDSFSNDLSLLLGQMLSEDPTNRLQTATEFISQLKQIESRVNGTAAAASRSGDVIEPGQCQGCGHINNQARTFCGKCGFALHWECVSCGSTIRVWDRTCVHCTASQEKATAHNGKHSPISAGQQNGNSTSLDTIREIFHRSGSWISYIFSKSWDSAQNIWTNSKNGASDSRHEDTKTSRQGWVATLSQGTGFKWCRRQIIRIVNGTVWLATTAYAKLRRMSQDDATAGGPESLGAQDTYNPSHDYDNSSSIGGAVTYAPSHNAPLVSRSKTQAARAEMADLFDDAQMYTTSDTLAAENDHASSLPYINLSSRYVFERELGKGGMGAVRLARDNSLGRHVAIKRIHGSMVRSKKAIDQFVIEARSIAALSFENIVQIYEFGRDEDGPFVVLEYVSGGTLLERIRKGKLETEEAVEIICHLCNALSIAHGNGIIHRDIKPANILLTKEGIPKLTDFGLAREQKSGDTQSDVGEIIGTIEFMPPEQRAGSSRVDERSDLWSLAATCYQMVTGKSPKVIREREMPVNLRNVLLKALEDRPRDRYQTANELKLAFQSAVARGAILKGDLEEGICASCNMVNDITRKFCRNCSESLVEICISCELECPIWEDVCGECGTSQSKTKSALLLEYQNAIDTAEQALAMFEFDSASDYLATVLACNYGFAGELVDVANQVSDKIEHERTVQLRLQDELLDLAIEQLATFDYEAAEWTLAKFPVELRSKEYADLLAETIQKKESAVKLRRDIQDYLKARVVDGLLETTDQYLLLKPNDDRMQLLFDRLSDKSNRDSAVRQTNYRAALDYFKQFDDRKCIETLSLYREDHQLNDDQSKLLDAATKRAANSERLKLEIDRLDHIGQPSIELLREYLGLRPSDQSCQLVLDGLVLRGTKKEALEYYKQFNDRKCIETLALYGKNNQLTDEQNKLLDAATKRATNSERLKLEIDRLDHIGQPSVELLREYLVLRPNDQSSQLVLNSLVLHASIKTALDYFDKFDDRNCIETLAQYEVDNQLTDEQHNLLDAATKRAAKSELLELEIDRLDQLGQHSIELLREYLELRPDDQSKRLVFDYLSSQVSRKKADRNRRISSVITIAVLIVATAALIYFGIEYGD